MRCIYLCMYSLCQRRRACQHIDRRQFGLCNVLLQSIVYKEKGKDAGEQQAGCTVRMSWTKGTEQQETERTFIPRTESHWELWFSPEGHHPGATLGIRMFYLVPDVLMTQYGKHCRYMTCQDAKYYVVCACCCQQFAKIKEAWARGPRLWLLESLSPLLCNPLITTPLGPVSLHIPHSHFLCVYLLPI